jgi:hypothetical protein
MTGELVSGLLALVVLWLLAGYVGQYRLRVYYARRRWPGATMTGYSIIVSTVWGPLNWAMLALHLVADLADRVHKLLKREYTVPR